MLTFKLRLIDGTTIFTANDNFGTHEVAFKTYQEFDTYIKLHSITLIKLC